MSAPDPNAPRPLKQFDSGAIVLILLGIILLAPGACAIFSAVTMLPFAFSDPGTLLLLLILWGICLAISYGGIRLIQRAGRRNGAGT